MLISSAVLTHLTDLIYYPPSVRTAPAANQQQSLPPLHRPPASAPPRHPPHPSPLLLPPPARPRWPPPPLQPRLPPCLQDLPPAHSPSSWVTSRASWPPWTCLQWPQRGREVRHWQLMFFAQIFHSLIRCALLLCSGLGECVDPWCHGSYSG